MKIDEIAQRIVTSFNEENTLALKNATMEMIWEIDENESMFSIVECPYIVAKGLYFMLTEDYLSVDNKMAVVKLAYFCCLRNYLNNMNKKKGDAGCEDLVSGCKLAMVLISMQTQYLMYGVIVRQTDYVNPQTHLRNQMLLFGGIAKESEINQCIFPLEDVINGYFREIYAELDGNLPTGKNLVMLKETCTSVIEDIETMISINFKESWIERMM